MPSVTDVQLTTTTDADPITQILLLLEKKQRNLGKRKEKLEGYQNQEKEGKELHKDQKEALAKYPDVLGQIEGLKELNDQVKKIQADAAKNQKRLSKQAAEEKRQLLSQTLRQYAQIRYLIDHRSTLVDLQADESILLDQLSTAIVPNNHSADSISSSVDFVLSIYQNASPNLIKNLTGKNSQEVRDLLEQLNNKLNSPPPQQEQQQQIEVLPPPPPPPVVEEEPIKEIEPTNNVPLVNRNFSDYPLKFDTRNPMIPLEQILQDQMFISTDLNHQTNDENREPSPDPNEYIPTMTVINSNINDQNSISTDNQQQNGQEQIEGTSKQSRGRGNYNRGGQYPYGGRNTNRRGSNSYYQQNRTPYGGQYDNSYNGAAAGGGQRPYYDNTRGRGGYRGNRGGNYRYNTNGNGYQNVRSAPPVSSEQRK